MIFVDIMTLAPTRFPAGVRGALGDCAAIGLDLLGFKMGVASVGSPVSCDLAAESPVGNVDAV